MVAIVQRKETPGQQRSDATVSPLRRPDTIGSGLGEETLSVGSRGPEVQQLQRTLALFGFKTSIDGVFGKDTARAVRAFQSMNDGLVVDGVCGPKTRDSLISLSKLLQSSLNAHGARLAIDGVIGSATESALYNFQRERGLKADRIVGPETLRALAISDRRSQAVVAVDHEKARGVNGAREVAGVPHWTDEMLKLHEGVRYKVYQCTAGKRTIGVGHNLDAHGTNQEIAYYTRFGATKAEVDAFLRDDLQRVKTFLDREFGKEAWYTSLPEARLGALIDLTFNLGEVGLLKFEGTLAAIRRGDFQAASARLQNTRWYHQVGHRAERITHMIRTGTIHPEIEALLR